MAVQIETIHDDVISAFNSKIEEAIHNTDNTIADKRKECEEGSVPNAGTAFDAVIRDLRRNALRQLNGVKTWIGTQIRSVIIQEIGASGIYKLRAIENRITAAEAEKQKAIEEKERIIKDNGTSSDYEKYIRYGHLESKMSGRLARKSGEVKNSSTERKEVNSDIEVTYQKYASKKIKSWIIGGIVTAACIAADFSMIYALFLAANYSSALAVLVAVISAAMLDAPPYVFGYIWTKSEDDSSLFELQGREMSSEAERKRKGNRILLVGIFIVIVLAFIGYLTVRVLSFLGGGDFSLGVHTVIEKDWSKIKDIDFSGADFLSTTVPFSTSVVALAVGRILYPFQTDYIKEAIVIIKNEINAEIKVCEEKIIDCEKQIGDLNDEMVTLKEELWTFYQGRKPFPTDEHSFKSEVSFAFQKLNLPLYEQTYTDCCQLLRNQANALLSQVNNQMAQYAADQSRIIAMDLSKEEEQCLDDYWVVSGNGKAQRPTTQSQLEAIRNTIKEIANALN